MITVKTEKHGEISVMKANRDTNGNPRYVIHFLALGLKKYESSQATRKAGLKIYRGKDFGGGFVFESFNLETSVNRILNELL